eukprot:TRINITY_DN4841_c0_g1_i1.p1 TRINITY_DN4841_c0_g1~~TRINITY_DN4841_c0_g1_i1.p1  ORF type:complete len:424 (-),score=81.37 TRINITY_DN4841_c0_g1_i1:115-1386(-)
MSKITFPKVAIGALMCIFVLSNFMYMRMMSNYESLDRLLTEQNQKLENEISSLHQQISLLQQGSSPASLNKGGGKGKYWTRDVPDARDDACKLFDWDSSNLPSASVIIVTHNEKPSVLYRTILSILDRTPAHLLDLIVVVDDFGTSPLDSDFYVLPKTKIVRNKDKQQGLIHSRVIGCDNSHPNSEVLIYLDAHCEVNYAWIEPLLFRVRQNRTNTVWPVIDSISYHDFSYTVINGHELTGGMDLANMNFIYEHIPSYVFDSVNYPLDPIPSPIMPGGLFAIEKNWFKESGLYDLGMGFWGAENLEMSVRLWACGGRVEMVPCSHVGHIFNDASNAPKYVTSSGVKNQIRFSEVWADDYKYLWYESWHISSDQISEAGDVTDRIKFKEEHKCKSFKWFHENIYPYMTMPAAARSRSDLDLWRP